jgi:oligopeptide transport system substrate-binding protein
MFKKVVSMLIVLTMVLSLAVGCSQPQETTPPAETPAETPGETPAPEEPAAEADTLVWNLGADPKTFDPGLNNASDGGHIINNMFEGLMRDTGTGLEPGIAESYEISANAEGAEGTVYTFKIREGAKWSDGQPVTAKDFEYSWKRVCDPATASEYSFIMAPYIKGANDYLNGTGSRDDMAVSSPDDSTLVVELNFPVPYFLSLTTFYTYLPVREDIVTANGEGWEKKPETCISNGPFKLEEYQTGSHISLVKNENYWDADSVKLEKIKALMIVEATTALSGYENGEIAVLDSGAIPQDEIPRLKAEDPYFSIAPRVGTYYGIFNVDAEPTNDIRVRKALTLAIDQKQICEQVAKGGQLPATGFIPPSLSYSTGESCRQLDADGNPVEEYGLDPNKAQVEEAQALLAEAGYPNGEGFPSITFLYNTNENHKKIAEALQEMWKANLNIDVELRNEEWATFQDTRRLGDFTLARGGWLGDYDDPMTMLDLYTSYSGNNDAQWRWNLQPTVASHDTVLNETNKEFDEVIAAAQLATGTERDALLKRAEEIMAEEFITFNIYYYTYVQVIDESVVEGVNRTTMGQFIFKDSELVK